MSQPNLHLWLRGLPALLLGTVSACGGGAATVPAATAAPIVPFSAASERDGMMVEGTLGTIPQRHIERTLEGRLRRFSACFSAGVERVPFLSGDVEMAFAVDTEGVVKEVHVARSDLGDWETEECLRVEAAKARFPRPRGGTGAEFSWSVGFDADERGATAHPLVSDGAGDALAGLEAGLVACGLADHAITAYFAAADGFLAMGGAGPTPMGSAAAACARAVFEGAQLPAETALPAKLQLHVRPQQALLADAP